MEIDESPDLSMREQLLFRLENFISADPMNRFYLLLWVTLAFCFIHAGVFVQAGGLDFGTSFYVILQTIFTGGYDDSFTGNFPRIMFIFAVLFGILVFTILVGFMTEYIMSMMQTLSEGKSRVACKQHTLILGWNESTVRCVCQLALLRRAYLKQNETWRRTIFPWTRVQPSTLLAAGKIVVMCNSKTKEEMDHVLREALIARGISPARTRVGTDVICRIGDPTEPSDLIRVGAHLAIAILTMMTEEDEAEEDDSGGIIANGITLKTLLAVKSVIYQYRKEDDTFFWNNFRCVLHLENYSPTIEAAMFTAPGGREVVHALDLRSWINSMMFSCGLNPALPNAMMSLLNFDGCAFRARDASELGVVGKTALDCTLMWENAVFVGVVSKGVRITYTDTDFDQGLACNPNRVITQNDRVLFISESSLPKLSKATWVPRFLGNAPRPPKRYIDTLVCGWRKQWSDGSRLAHRIAMLVAGVSPGCNIVFLNMYNPADFADIIDNALKDDGQRWFQRIPWKTAYHGKTMENYWEIQGVRLFHVHGDPGDARVLRDVMKNPNQSMWKGDQFEVVIVLGTSANPNLKKRSQDLRMLSTYVLVHKIHAEIYGDSPLHVIGENQFDSTSTLAHAVTWKDSTKDLINTQAIFARGLVQCLAFPLMQPAVAQLFHDAPGSPSLRMFPVGSSMIPVGSATFGDITRTIVEHPEMSGAVCLGVILGDEMILAPSPDEYIDINEGDLIAVIERGTSVVQKGGPRRTRSWYGDDGDPVGICICNGDSGRYDYDSDESVPDDSLDEASSLIPGSGFTRVLSMGPMGQQQPIAPV